jgi:hypothetical protein
MTLVLFWQVVVAPRRHYPKAKRSVARDVIISNISNLVCGRTNQSRRWANASRRDKEHSRPLTHVSKPLRLPCYTTTVGGAVRSTGSVEPLLPQPEGRSTS